MAYKFNPLTGQLDLVGAAATLPGYFRSDTSVLDDGTVALPAITANHAAHGFIQVSAAGVIELTAEFEIDSTGNVVLVRGTTVDGVDQAVVNADTDGKLCLGTAADQNPLTIKNRLGGTKIILITLWYG